MPAQLESTTIKKTPLLLLLASIVLLEVPPRQWVELLRRVRVLPSANLVVLVSLIVRELVPQQRVPV